MRLKFQDGTVIASGYVPRDADYRVTENTGVALCKFSIKVGDVVDGDQRTAIWLDCTCWRSVAEAAAKIRKGDVVLAAGTMKSREYTGRDGELRKAEELVCEWIGVMKVPAQPTNQSPAKSSKYEDVSSDDGLPF